MAQLERFDPFNNRLCRNVRNALSEGFKDAFAYVHLEQGNLSGAKRIADKAVSALEVHQDRLSPYADPQLLLAKLKALDPLPPRPVGTARRG